MKQGEICLINLDPPLGAEIKKTRPAIIMNDNASMKSISIILALLCITQIFGQEPINQTTKKGQKMGKWLEYNENGSIRNVQFYEPVFSMGMYEEFVFDTWDGQKDTLRSADTISFGHKLLWSEHYEYDYDAKNQLKRVTKIINDQEPIFLYGPNKEIAIKEDQFSIRERISEIASFTMTLGNETERVLQLIPKFEAENFKTEQNIIVLPPQKETSFTFQLIIQPQNNRYTVTLRNDSISIDIFVKTVGYHIESKDVSKDNQLSVEGSFVYWRSGNEALGSIYDKEQEKILHTFSLAQEITTIDLKGIKPGEYKLCNRDFSTDQQTCCKLKIEK